MSDAEHPDPQSDAVFAALAHPDRRRILDLLVEAPGLTVSALASHFTVSRVQVIKHLATLEAAELVISQREGRTRRLFFNAIPIQRIHDRWTDRYGAFFAGHLTDIQRRVEDRAAGRNRRHA